MPLRIGSRDGREVYRGDWLNAALGHHSGVPHLIHLVMHDRIARDHTGELVTCTSHHRRCQTFIVWCPRGHIGVCSRQIMTGWALHAEFVCSLAEGCSGDLAMSWPVVTSWFESVHLSSPTAKWSSKHHITLDPVKFRTTNLACRVVMSCLIEDLAIVPQRLFDERLDSLSARVHLPCSCRLDTQDDSIHNLKESVCIM